MATVYRRSTNSFSTVLTTRLIDITTAAAQRVILTSGAKAMFVSNVGPTTIVYGDSNLTASSGNILFYSMSELFNPIQGDFEMYFRADSAEGTIAINEFV